jgi:hypothetical protein
MEYVPPNTWPFVKADMQFLAIEVIRKNICDPLGGIYCDARDVALVDRPVYTSDTAVYTCRDGDPMLHFGPPAVNPILKNLNEAVRQLSQGKNFIVPPSDLEQVLADQGTLHIPLRVLGLSEKSAEFSYFKVATFTPADLTSFQRPLAERIYGESLRELNHLDREICPEFILPGGIDETKIFVLNPEYVSAHTSEHAIARVCRLGCYEQFCMFGAVSRFV